MTFHTTWSSGGNGLSWGKAMQVAELWRQAAPFVKGGDLLAAEPALRRILLIEPMDIEALFYVGQIELSRSAWQEAARCFERALKFGITMWQARYFYGICLWNLADHAVAVQAFQEVVRLMPDGIQSEEKVVSQILSTALDEDVSADLWDSALRFLRDRWNPARLSVFIKLCGLTYNAPTAHKERVFINLAIPSTEMALMRGAFASALAINTSSILALASIPSSQERWAWHFSRTNPLFIKAGERIRQARPELVLPSHEVPRVAFIVDYAISAGSGLEMLLNILDQVAPSRMCGIVPVVYAVQEAPSEELISRCSTLGIEVLDFTQRAGELPYEHDVLGASLAAMRDQACHDGISVAVFLSTYEGFVCLAASMGIAPLQIYLTLGFHSLECRWIDAYVACASLLGGKKEILGRPWKTIPLPFPYTFPPAASQEMELLMSEATTIRAGLLDRWTTILGTIARPEKLDEDFVATLARILDMNPGAVFLWFGKSKWSIGYGSAIELFRKYGIADRCLFQGWVDTKIYAFVLDIHLDCFGLPTGLTMAETFSAGTAYVLRRGKESLHIGLTAILASIEDAPAYDETYAEAKALFIDAETNKPLMILADDSDQYVQYANQLIQDATYRRLVGQAARRFMDTYFHDSGHMGHLFAKEIMAIIAEKRISGQTRTLG